MASEKIDYLLVHTKTNHRPSKMDILPKTFLQSILAAKWLVRHSSMYVYPPNSSDDLCLLFCLRFFFYGTHISSNYGIGKHVQIPQIPHPHPPVAAVPRGRCWPHLAAVAALPRLSPPDGRLLGRVSREISPLFKWSIITEAKKSY